MQIKTVKCLIWQKTHIHNKIVCTETGNQGEKFHIVTRGKNCEQFEGTTIYLLH